MSEGRQVVVEKVPAVGDTVRLQNLIKSSEYNGLEGIVTADRNEKGRYKVRIEYRGKRKDLALLPKNVVRIHNNTTTDDAASESSPISYDCVEIAPTTISDSEETIRTAVTASSVLPPPGFTSRTSTEPLELARLSSALGWSDPRGLFGYTSNSEYKDLYVYFDYGAPTSSPVNELATKAFEMYGLGGARVRGKPDWGPIRGSAIATRLEPDRRFDATTNRTYVPGLTLEETYDTLVFFRNSRIDAHKIALKRDSVRAMASMSSSVRNVGGNGPFTYLGPNGTRTETQVRDDQDRCDRCGKTQALVGRLKACQRCKVTFYCGKECQTAAWKDHKKVCKSLGRN